jgi:cytochrome c biogenesis factor
MCTVELYSTLKVRSSFVKSVYCVAVYTIRNFDIYLFIYLFIYLHALLVRQTKD